MIPFAEWVKLHGCAVRRAAGLATVWTNYAWTLPNVAELRQANKKRA